MSKWGKSIILWGILAAVLMLPTLGAAQGVGIYSRPDCTTLTSPVTNKTECLDTTRGVWTNYDGTGWQSDYALTTKVYLITDPEWGADPTGVTPIDTAIGKIKTAVGTGSGVIQFPCGAFLTAGLTFIDVAIDLIGGGGTSAFGSGAPLTTCTTIKSTTNAAVIKYAMANHGAGPLNGGRFQRVANLAILGSTTAGTLQHCLQVDNRGLVVENVAIDSCGGAGLYLTDSQLGQYDHIFINGVQGHGIAMDGSGSGQSIEGNQFANLSVITPGGIGIYCVSNGNCVNNTLFAVDIENCTAGQAIYLAGGANPSLRNRFYGIYEGGCTTAVTYIAGSKDNYVSFTKYSDAIVDGGTTNITLGPNDVTGVIRPGDTFGFDTSGSSGIPSVNGGVWTVNNALVLGQILYGGGSNTVSASGGLTFNGTALGITGNTNQIVLGTTNTGTISMAALGASRAWTFPNVSGTIITTGDSGTVTNTMLAGSIALSQITSGAQGRIPFGNATPALSDSANLAYTGTTVAIASSTTNTGAGITLTSNGSGGSNTIKSLGNSASTELQLFSGGGVPGASFLNYAGNARILAMYDAGGITVGAPTGGGQGVGTASSLIAFTATPRITRSLTVNHS